MRIALATAIVCLSIASLSTAAEVTAAIRTHISIGAGGLGYALRALSKEKGIHIIFVNEDVSTLNTQGANGSLTVDEALNLLLDGTGLTFRYIDAETVSIIPAEATAASSSISDGRFLRRQAEQPASSDWSAFRLSQAETPANATQKSTPSTSQTPHAEAAASLITEVIVTSRRFSEAVRSVPISISAYDRKALDVAGVKDFSGVAQFTPGVTFNSSNNLIAIRGICQRPHLVDDPDGGLLGLDDDALDR